MGRRRKSKNPLNYISLPEISMSDEAKNGIAVVVVLGLGLLCLLGFFDFAGPVGKYLARGEALAFGWGKWLFPFILFGWGFFLYKNGRASFRGAGLLGLFLLFISFQALLQIFIPPAEWREVIQDGQGGGFIGLFLADVFIKVLGFWGGVTILFVLIMTALMLVFDTSLMRLVGGESFLARIFASTGSLFARLFGRRDEEEIEEKREKKEDEELEAEPEAPVAKKTVVEEEGKPEAEEEEDESGESLPALSSAISAKHLSESEIWKTNRVKIDLPIELLDTNSSKATSGDIKNNQLTIQRTLENFGIPVEMADTSVGPTVTQYSFRPADGVKLSRITTLGNDLALALSAHPLRIEAPIPGKPLVGIEVPNKTKAVVGLRELVEAKEFHDRKNNLTIVLGRDVAGAPWYYDITRMPHLLVAGATNSGKSVCLNSIVLSLLYQNNPEDLRFIMVDPKRVELTVYDGIPHLLTPVITNVPKTINALRWCLNEMDRRFDVLQNFHKRNIQSYNQTAKEKMPYIIFIVDELADLMVTAGRDIEASVIRLAQMARAVGIHLVLATQRPSVDVITGLIKANMPARIAFSVASGVDSKTILDSLGAEKLLGKGDMLFQTPEISKPKRIQGAYVSDGEIKKIVDYIKGKSGQFEYVDGVTDKQKVGGVAGVGLDNGGDEDDADEMLEEAIDTVLETGKASASFLQRRLSLGYARAARILDIMERMGLIGPSNGSKPREILMTKDQYRAKIAGAPLHDQAAAEAPKSYLGGENENSLGEAPEDDTTVFTKDETEEIVEEEAIIPEEEEAEEVPAIAEADELAEEAEVESDELVEAGETEKEEEEAVPPAPKKKKFNPDDIERLFSR